MMGIDQFTAKRLPYLQKIAAKHGSPAI